MIVAGLVSVSILIGVWYGAKWKSVAVVEAANAQAWEDTAHRFEAELGVVKAEVQRLRMRVVELEALPDVAAVHASLLQHDQKSAEAMDRHDEHAEARAARIVGVMEEVRDAVRSS